MRGDPIRLLLFEDTKADGEAFLDALRKKASRARPIQVIWFSVGLKAPSNTDARAGRPYPAHVIKRDRPTIITLNGGPDGIQMGHRDWWQHQFDAAVLDVIHQASQERVGETFAKWLGQAEFTGPVFLVSKTDVATANWGLRDLRPRIKQENWVQDIVDGIDRLSPTVHGEVKVNYRGRPAEHLIRDFFHHRPETVPRSLAYFGPDHKVGHQLAEFFDMRRFGRCGEHAIEDMHTTLLEAKKHNYTIPWVIVADCGPGASLRDDLLHRIERADDVLAQPPIWLILAERREVGDIRSLARMNAAVVDRNEIIERPSVWAADAVERLRQTYLAFRAVAPPKVAQLGESVAWSTNTLEAGSTLLQALLPPLAMARSIERLVTTRPSLVGWISPQAEDVLNTTFSIVPRPVVRRLADQRWASERQVKLFAPHGQQRRKASTC